MSPADSDREAADLQAEVQRLPFRLDDRPADWMLRHRSPRRIHDLGSDPSFATAGRPLHDDMTLLVVRRER